MTPLLDCTRFQHHRTPEHGHRNAEEEEKEEEERKKPSSITLLGLHHLRKTNYHPSGIGHETHVPPRQALVGGGVTRVSPSRGFRLMRTRGPWRLVVDGGQEWTRVSRNRRLIQRRTGHPSAAPFRRSGELACLSVGVAARIEVVLGIPSVPIQFSVFFLRLLLSSSV